MKTLLKLAREQKGLKTREVAQLLKIDQALISKFENGQRNPTKTQIIKLAQLLEIDLETLTTAWLKEKILQEVANEEFGLKALQAAEKELNPKATDHSVDLLFEEMEALKNKMEAFRKSQNNS